MPSNPTTTLRRLRANPRWQGAIFWLIAVMGSLQFALTYGYILHPTIDLTAYAAGAVAYPFRTRVLMRPIYTAALHRWPNGYESSHAHLTTPEAVTILVAFLGCLALISITRAFIRSLLGRDSGFAWFSLLALLVLSYNDLLVPESPSTPYDLPGTAFFALCCFAAFTRKRWLYYPVFIFGTFNRESTLFLPAVFLLFELREDLPLIPALRKLPALVYAEVAAQLIAWRVIVVLCQKFTGGVIPQASHLPTNLHLLANPIHWPDFLTVFGFLWVPYIFFFDRIGNLRLQRVAWLIPPWAVVTLWYANVLETRTHVEWTAYIVVCVTLIAHTTWTQRGVDPAVTTLA